MCTPTGETDSPQEASDATSSARRSVAIRTGKQIASRKLLMQRAQLGALWRFTGVARWDREAQERKMNMRRPDSLCCIAETNATWLSNYTPIKIKKKDSN